MNFKVGDMIVWPNGLGETDAYGFVKNMDEQYITIYWFSEKPKELHHTVGSYLIKYVFKAM